MDKDNKERMGLVIDPEVVQVRHNLTFRTMFLLK